MCGCEGVRVEGCRGGGCEACGVRLWCCPLGRHSSGGEGLSADAVSAEEPGSSHLRPELPLLREPRCPRAVTAEMLACHSLGLRHSPPPPPPPQVLGGRRRGEGGRGRRVMWRSQCSYATTSVRGSWRKEGGCGLRKEGGCGLRLPLRRRHNSVWLYTHFLLA